MRGSSIIEGGILEIDGVVATSLVGNNVEDGLRTSDN